VRENRTPGSVRGASGDWCPYRDMPPQNVETSGLRRSEMYIGSFRLKSVRAPSGAQCYFCGEFGKQSIHFAPDGAGRCL